MQDKNVSGLTHKEIRKFADEVSETLQETEAKPRRQIYNIIRHCGVEFAQEVLAETQKIESEGGMTVNEGGRRRTSGGVFFYVARSRMSEEDRKHIFYYWRVLSEQREQYESQFPVFNWEERLQILQDVLANQGKVTEVKVNLEGRPGNIERRQNLVVLTMQDQIDETMVFPNGVPTPPSDPVSYVIFISSKQWERVEEAAKNPNDNLIIEGHCTFDPELDSMTVFTTFITTRKLNRKNKKQKKAEDGGDNKGPANNKSASSNKQYAKDKQSSGGRNRRKQETEPESFITFGTSTSATAEEATPPTPPEPEFVIDLPDDLPAEVAKELTSLHKAAATYRQKINSLQEKPSEERFGMEMTQKLLGNIERKIAALEKQHFK